MPGQRANCSDLYQFHPAAISDNAAGDCKYEMHEDDIQFDEIKEEYDMIPEKEKLRCRNFLSGLS